jgi:hypothetical protein
LDQAFSLVIAEPPVGIEPTTCSLRVILEAYFAVG